MSRRAVWTALALLAIAAGLFFRSAGAWLVIDEPLQPSQAIVVLGGGAPFRAMEAAEVFHQGVAPEVWLTRGERNAEEVALEQLHVHRTQDFEVSQLVLQRLGVPESAIRVLPDETPSTADEIRVVERELRARGGSRVVLVTSKYHGRRVRTIWNRLVGNSPEAIVRISRTDASDPAHWWRHTSDATFVWREWAGILNVLAGLRMAH